MEEMSLILKHEDGSVVIAALLILLVVTFLGVAATNTTNIELQISHNDRLHKLAFCAADNGTELGIELIEQNIACATGFEPDGVGLGATLDGNISVVSTSLDLWRNTTAAMPSDANRDVFFPAGYSGNEPHTNLTMGGSTVIAAGGAIQMAAGYEGVGKGVASGGAFILYDIFSQHLGRGNSEAIIMARWRHVIGQEGSCNY
jgi:hypothetical protein